MANMPCSYEFLDEMASTHTNETMRQTDTQEKMP